MTLTVTDDIKLELLEHKHENELYQLAKDNSGHLRQWLPWIDRMQDSAFMHRFINIYQQKNKEGLEYAFVVLYNNKIVGRIGLHKIDSYNKIGEIGYWLIQPACGKGIISRSCVAIVKYCFNQLQLNRIEIKCGTENYKSKAIPIKLGFEHEGILRQAEFLHGKFINLHLYAMLKRDWETIIQEHELGWTKKDLQT